MKYLLTLFFLALTTWTIAQEKADIERLLGCWTDSREENTTEFRIFRPCDYKTFPPSRFRLRMVLKENNECDWLYLAPNDAHEMKKGTWQLNDANGELKIFSEDGKEVKHFKIAEVSEDELKLTNN